MWRKGGLIVSAFCRGPVSAFCGGNREASKNMSTRVMPFAFFRCCGFRCFPLSSCSGKMNSLSRPLWRGQTDVPKIRAHTYGLIVSAFCGGAVSVFCTREASKNMSTRVIPFLFTVAFFVVSFCHHVVGRWIHRLGLSWRG